MVPPVQRLIGFYKSPLGKITRALLREEIMRFAGSVKGLRVLGLGYPMYAVGMIIIQAMNGAGDTRTPSILNFFCFWLLQIPLAWTLARVVGLGPSGVFWSIVISESTLTIVGVLVFRRGRWRTLEV